MIRHVHNQVGLITYADRLAGTLPALEELLVRGPLAGVFGGVHVLPFFRPFDGADAGFDPEDHTEVDPRLGSWADVTRLGATLEVVADAIVNHVSVRSPAYARVLERGFGSPEAGMFLSLDAVFPGGVTEAELLAIYRPRPGLPFTTAVARDGSRRLQWTTFTSEQADLDVSDPAAQRYLADILGALAEAGVRLVRFDAVGYAVKARGTSCFMLPETFAFIDALAAQARALGMEVLVEVHGHHQLQVAVARHADYVYDFALSPLLLHGLFTGDAAPLRAWLDERPANAVTVLDTHDGIGVVDVGGDAAAGVAPLLEPDALDALVEAIHVRTNGASRLATGAAASNVDLYQINSTYFDALGGDDGAYLLARLVQLFTPGIPQIYYVGLLAGGNDVELLRRTGIGRDINRHHYTPEEVAEALERPVVRALLGAIRLRNAHPAFGGACTVTGGADGVLGLAWGAGEARAELVADFRKRTYALTVTGRDGVPRTVGDLLDLTV